MTSAPEFEWTQSVSGHLTKIQEFSALPRSCCSWLISKPSCLLDTVRRAPWFHSEILSCPFVSTLAERTLRGWVAHGQGLFPSVFGTLRHPYEVYLGRSRMDFLHNLHSHVYLLLLCPEVLASIFGDLSPFPSPTPEVSAKILYNLYHLPSCYRI